MNVILMYHILIMKHTLIIKKTFMCWFGRYIVRKQKREDLKPESCETPNMIYLFHSITGNRDVFLQMVEKVLHVVNLKRVEN